MTNHTVRDIVSPAAGDGWSENIRPIVFLKCFKGEKMRKIKFMVLLSAMFFILPVSLMAAEDGPVISSGSAEAATSESLVCETPEPQQVVDLENAYEARFQELRQELAAEKNPWARENIQKEAEALKFEQELAFQELYLKMAIAAGDLERAAQLQQTVNSHYNVPESTPAADLSEPQQDPEKDVILPASPKRYPDDA